MIEPVQLQALRDGEYFLTSLTNRIGIVVARESNNDGAGIAVSIEAFGDADTVQDLTLHPCVLVVPMQPPASEAACA